MRIVIVSIVVVLSAASVACVGSGADVSAQAPEAGAVAAQDPGPEAPAIADQAAICSPPRIALFRDRSRSVVPTATPPVTLAHVDALLNLIAECGGELGYGEIVTKGQSFAPLTRVRVDQPPATPLRRVVGDPFEQQRLDGLYSRQLLGFRRSLDARQQETAAAIEAFRAAIAPRLSEPASANSSDVLGAAERGLLYIQEPQVGWGATPRRVILLSSDAQHNTGPWTFDRPEGVEILLVNGVGSTGAFSDDDVRLFESLESAIRWLAQTGGVEKVW